MVIHFDSLSITWYKTEVQDLMDQLDKLLDVAREQGDYDFNDYQEVLTLYYFLQSYLAKKNLKKPSRKNKYELF